MNILDIILLLCFIPAIIGGIQKGFIFQVVSILSIVLGAWLSFKFASVLSAWMSGWIDTAPQVLHILSFVAIFLIVAMVLMLIGKAIEGVIKIIMLGWLNKLLGVIFSLMKAFLIIGLVIIVFNTLNEQLNLVNSTVLNESVLYNPLKNLAYDLFPRFKSLLVK